MERGAPVPVRLTIAAPERADTVQSLVNSFPARNGETMNDNESFVPRHHPGVMVSSTFVDLEQHRAKLMRAIEGAGLHAVAMEQDSALPTGTVVDSSLRKVRDAAAYVGIVSHRYGNVPDPAVNPEGLSLTELEFREARRLGRPTLIFIMGPDHDVKPRSVEQDPEKRRKLEAFRSDVKRATADSPTHRVYKEFNSLDEFTVAATQSVGDLRRLLDSQTVTAIPRTRSQPVVDDGVPKPPALYAEPRYIGSHAFVGRTAELALLCDWAAPAEAHPVALFEAIGGAGKSMLTWEWTTRHANAVRDDWAGTFWYSFYEKGAIMTDFCARALTYMTGQPLRTFRRKRQPELTELLLRQLEAKPWLLVLDGLERVLVAYHRYDAAQLVDEDAGTSDEIARRDPCAAIRPEDDDLLRRLAGAAPSKVLITSRLVPRVLVNPSNQPIPGVLYERLLGLRPADAERLLRGCGVRGESREIQAYLQRHCDCHPLVTGIVAGLVGGYLPDRGNFDAWAGDPHGGGQLNLADLDLVQKRNHILEAAMAALPDASRQLLGTLALLSDAADYETISAFNPHLPPEPEAVPEPEPPEGTPFWNALTEEARQWARDEHAADQRRREEYEQAHAEWHRSPERVSAPGELSRTVRDLERRGLLQYDPHAERYDLHPVVRGIASGQLRTEDRDRFGQRVLDHFSLRSHSPFAEAETLDDVRDGMTVVRTLIRMGRMAEASVALDGDLADALLFNLDASTETLALMRPFFTPGWGALSVDLGSRTFSRLATIAFIAVNNLDQFEQALTMADAILRTDLADANRTYVRVDLSNTAGTLADMNRLAAAARHWVYALELAERIGDLQNLFVARLDRFSDLIRRGLWAEAEDMWLLLDSMDQALSRALYRPGKAELEHARLLFCQGLLIEERLTTAEQLSRSGRARRNLKDVLALRGRWLLVEGGYAGAADNLREVIRMDREVGESTLTAETQLALARFRLGQLPDARQEAVRLSTLAKPAHLALAELWDAIGDRERAIDHADKAYRKAWADGEPYVQRYDLDRAADILRAHDAEVPTLRPYDPTSDERLPWEDDIVALLARLRSEANEPTVDD